MYRVSSVLLAGIWATALSAQTPPSFFPLAVMPQATAVQTDAALRQLLKGYSPAETRVCAIPLRVVPVPKNLEQMPVLRPPTDKIDNMPAVKLPAPACDEEKR
jgi:hypothetical protein